MRLRCRRETLGRKDWMRGLHDVVSSALLHLAMGAGHGRATCRRGGGDALGACSLAPPVRVFLPHSSPACRLYFPLHVALFLSWGTAGLQGAVTLGATLSLRCAFVLGSRTIKASEFCTSPQFGKGLLFVILRLARSGHAQQGACAVYPPSEALTFNWRSDLFKEDVGLRCGLPATLPCCPCPAAARAGRHCPPGDQLSDGRTPLALCPLPAPRLRPHRSRTKQLRRPCCSA